MGPMDLLSKATNLDNDEAGRTLRTSSQYTQIGANSNRKDRFPAGFRKSQATPKA